MKAVSPLSAVFLLLLPLSPGAYPLLTLPTPFRIAGGVGARMLFGVGDMCVGENGVALRRRHEGLDGVMG
jgi:hypothetical protein